jgi:hypothetical protein
MTIDKQNPQLTSGEKASLKKLRAIENKQKSNPELSARNKAASDAKRERRKEEGTSKSFK